MSRGGRSYFRRHRRSEQWCETWLKANEGRSDGGISVHTLKKLGQVNLSWVTSVTKVTDLISFSIKKLQIENSKKITLVTEITFGCFYLFKVYCVSNSWYTIVISTPKIYPFNKKNLLRSCINFIGLFLPFICKQIRITVDFYVSLSADLARKICLRVLKSAKNNHNCVFSW